MVHPTKSLYKWSGHDDITFTLEISCCRIAFGLQPDEAEGFISKESTGKILRREYSKLGKIRYFFFFFFFL